MDRYDRALFACSLWLHLTYVGMACAAIGLIEAFVPGARLAGPLALAMSGVVLAGCAWDRARAVLATHGPGEEPPSHHLHHAWKDERELRPIGHDD
jgi:hypothetical protein